MPLGPNQNLAAFQQLARRAVSDTTPITSSGSSIFLGDRDLRHPHHAHSASSTRVSRSTLNITKQQQQASPRANQSVSLTNISFGDASSLEDVSSGEGSDAEVPRSEKKKGLIYQKTENVITRMRDIIAQWDVFTSRSESPPFVACLKVTVWFIPILITMGLWDTMAIVFFEIPHHCWMDHPGFLLGWHFVMMILAMYGFMLSYLSSGFSPRTKLAAISLGIHYFLLLYRIFMEVYFNGFRGQGKLYIERTRKLW